MERQESGLLDNKKDLLYSRRAYCNDDLRSIQTIIQAPDSINERSSESGKTLLHRACCNGNAALVQWLLKRGANVWVVDYKADTPLHAASSFGSLDVVQQLVIAGKDEKNCISDETKTGVSRSSDRVDRIRRKTGVQTENGSSRSFINMTNFEFKTALDVARAAEKVSVADFLVESGAGSGDLLSASSRNNEQEIAAIIESSKTASQDVNVQTVFGLTPLHYSTKSIETVRLLCSRGGDPTIKDDDGNTALHFLVESECSREVIEMLVKKGADINARNCQGKTPLHHASIRFQSGFIECLLQLGADSNVQDISGATALHYLALYQKLDTNHVSIKLLQKVMKNRTNQICASQIDFKMFHALRMWENHELMSVHVNGCSKYLKDKHDELNYLSCRTLAVDWLISPNDIVNHAEAESQEHLKAIELLVHTSNITDTKDNSGRTALHIAAAIGYTEIVKCLLEKHNADICARDVYGTTVLHEAVANGHIIMTKLILETAARKQCSDKLLNCRELYRGQTPLHKAVQGSHDDIIDVLLKHRADINLADSTPLHTAIRQQNFELAVKLLSVGADVNVQNAIGNTPLHESACLSTSEKLKKLVLLLCNIYGADVNRQNHIGRIVLHLAAWNVGYGSQQNIDLVRLFCELGARVDIADDYGNTPLHVMDHMTAETVEILIDHGANINARNSRGMSPLHIACRTYKLQCVKKLLEYGANCNVVDAFGASPLHYVCCPETRYTCGVTDITLNLVKVLLKHGADCNIQTKVSGKTPLHLAAQSDEVRPQTLEQLILNADLSTCDALRNSISQCIAQCHPKFIGSVLRRLNHNPGNYGGLTCLHVNAVEGHSFEWMDNWTANFVAMQDRLGRTCLHLRLSCGYECDQFFRDKLGLFYTTDFLHRNCFHHMCIAHFAPHAEPLEYSESFSRLLRDHPDLINARDVYGRTPLFYAAIYQSEMSVNRLIAAGGDQNVADNDGVTPENVMTAHKTNAMLINRHTGVIIKESLPVKLPSDETERVPGNIHKTWESLQPLPVNETYNRILREKVTEFVSKLMDKVAELDPLFRSTPTLVGSALEGTRAEYTNDEFDFMIILNSFQGLLDYSTRHECFPTHIRLKQTDDTTQDIYQNYTDATSVVQPILVKERLYSLLTQACYYPEVWESSPFEYLLSKVENCLHSPAVAVKLSLNRLLDERQRLHFYRHNCNQISIDFVPAVPTEWELPGNTEFGSYVREHGSSVDRRGFAVMKPQKYSIGNEADGFCPVIFIFLESEVIRQSVTVKAAYTVMKWLLFRKAADGKDEIGINKYALKSCVIECVVAKRFRAETLHEITEDNLTHCVRVILQQLWKCVQEDGTRSVTDAEHYQPVWKFESFAGFMKAYLSRYGLPYTSDLFDPQLESGVYSQTKVPCDMQRTYIGGEKSKKLIKELRQSYRGLQMICEMFSVATCNDRPNDELETCSSNISEPMRRNLVRYTIKYDDYTNEFHVNKTASALLMVSPHRMTV